MTDFHLESAPIVEAIVDLDCELPANINFDEIEKHAQEALGTDYPEVRRKFAQGHALKPGKDNKLTLSIQHNLHAIQFRTSDQKQLVQFRPAGYSFNRLAPYESLDKYLDEIARTWEIYTALVQPVKLSKIGLRYINRIYLPVENGGLIIDDYIKPAPRLPDCSADSHQLEFASFVQHHVAFDRETGNRVNIVMTTEDFRDDALPLILDIDAFALYDQEAPAWSTILEIILQLRSLKNSVFCNLLTDKCLGLFSKPQ